MTPFLWGFLLGIMIGVAGTMSLIAGLFHLLKGLDVLNTEWTQGIFQMSVAVLFVAVAILFVIYYRP